MYRKVMTRICPSCGAPALDDQSVFCNKCGSTFPDDQPKKILVRTTPRAADTPAMPPPPPEPVVPPAPTIPEYHAPAAPPTRSYAEPPRVRAPARRPAMRATSATGTLPFKKLIGRDFIRPLYWLGVIAILLVVFAGITTGPQAAATSADAGSNAETETSSTDILSGIPIFWIGVFIIANLLWRVICEMSAALFALHSAAGPSPESGFHEPGFDSLLEDDMTVHTTGATGEMVSCPRCGKIVPAEDIHACEHCGSEGCSSCIRMMGLIKKKWTCRDCFQKK